MQRTRVQDKNSMAMAARLNLFAIPVEIERRRGADLPVELLGAYVVCYASAPTHVRAMELVVETLQEDHYELLDLYDEIAELDPEKWDDHVRTTFPQAIQDMPSQVEIFKRLQGEGVFYGPFYGYEKR